MKIEVNISKKYFIILLSSIIILAGIFTVYAFSQNGVGGNPAVAGHSVDEIDWSKVIPSVLTLGAHRTNIRGYDGAGWHWFTYANGSNTEYVALGVNMSSGVVSIPNGLCLGDGCRSSWASVGGSTSVLLANDWSTTNTIDILNYTPPVAAKYVFGRIDSMSGSVNYAYQATIQARWLASNGAVIKDWDTVLNSEAGHYSTTFNLPMLGASTIQFKVLNIGMGWSQAIHVWGYTY